jgi:hypothetical protein
MKGANKMGIKIARSIIVGDVVVYELDIIEEEE